MAQAQIPGKTPGKTAGKTLGGKKPPRIVDWVWEGADRSGKRQKGEVRALSEALAKAELRRQGIAPLRVKKKPTPLFSLSGGQKKQKITSKDVTVFSRQLATMVAAGVPLVQAFDIIAKGNDNISFQNLIGAVKGDIEAGSTLAEAMRKHPKVFDNLFCNLIYAGEQAGILESLLNKIAIYKEKTEAIKSKIKKAMFYPVAIVAVAIIISIILLLFVIPQFENLFSSFGAELPLPTQMVLAMSAFMQAYWFLIIGGLGGGVYGLIWAKKNSPKFNRVFDRAILQVPVFGPLVQKSIIARFARTLATMFAAGVPLVEAMESVAGAAGNTLYQDGIMKMREEVATGQRLQQAMNQATLFPNMVIQMVAIGEESGTLDGMLGKVADFYEEEVDDAVAGLSSLIEPMIMAVLGVLIGGLVISMYLPIFQMGAVV